MPDFESIYTSTESAMLRDAYDAITKTDMWDYMRLKTTPGRDGFMFSSAIELVVINAQMTYRGHDGASYGWTMRQMEGIAKRGWDEHRKQVRRDRSIRQLRKWAEGVRRPTGYPCGCRAKKGYTFGWCGVGGGGVPGCDH